MERERGGDFEEFQRFLAQEPRPQGSSELEGEGEASLWHSELLLGLGREEPQPLEEGQRRQLPALGSLTRRCLSLIEALRATFPTWKEDPTIGGVVGGRSFEEFLRCYSRFVTRRRCADLGEGWSKEDALVSGRVLDTDSFVHLSDSYSFSLLHEIPSLASVLSEDPSLPGDVIEATLHRPFRLETENPLPAELLGAVRFLVMTPTERYFFGEPQPTSGCVEKKIGDRNEGHAVHQLFKAFSTLASRCKDNVAALSGFSHPTTQLLAAYLQGLGKLFDAAGNQAVRVGSACLTPNPPSAQLVLSLQDQSRDVRPEHNLFEWVRSHVSPNDTSAMARIGVAQFADTGRGMVALSDINPGDDVLVIPKRLLICIDTVLDDATLGPIFRELLHDGLLETEAALILFVLHERFVNPASFWKPYFEALPSFDSFPLLFPFSDLMELESTTLFDEILAAKEHVEQVHSTLFPELCERYPTLFPEEVCSYENMLWIRCLFDSRAMEVSLDGSGELSTVLVPLVDMLNHSLSAHVREKYFDASRQALVLKAFLPCFGRHEIFLNYGGLRAKQLLQFYGYLQDNVELDSSPITLDALLETEREGEEEARATVLAQYGLGYSHLLSNDRVSPLLLGTLRVLVSSPEELVALASGRQTPFQKLSESNESRALSAFISLLNSLESTYATTLEEDEEILQQGETLSENARLAIRYRISEKRIAASTRNALQTLS